MVFSPNHLVDHTGVALNDFNHLGRHIFLNVVWDRDAIVTSPIHFHRSVHRLEQPLLVDAGQNETSLVQSLWTLSGGADTYGGEGVSHAGEEAGLFGEGATVRDNCESVHLEAVIVVEAQGLMLDHTLVQPKARRFQSFPAAGMAGVQNGHVIFFCHFVNSLEQGEKILLCINILLTMSREEDILALFQTKTAMNIRSLNLS